MRKGIASLESAASSAMQNLSPEERADYHFRYFRELSRLQQEDSLSVDEMGMQMEKSRYDIIKGLNYGEMNQCLISFLYKLELLTDGIYFNERIARLEAVHALTASNILMMRMMLKYEPDIDAEKHLVKIQENEDRQKVLKQMISEIQNLEIWNEIEETTGYMRNNLNLDMLDTQACT